MPARKKVSKAVRDRILDCYEKRRAVYRQFGKGAKDPQRMAALAAIPSPRALAVELDVSVWTIYTEQSIWKRKLTESCVTPVS